MFIQVQKSFYTTFDGRCSFCIIKNLTYNHNDIQFNVIYSHDDEEQYNLVSRDGVFFSGVAGIYYNKVSFEFFRYEQTIVLAGTWKCGDNKGEWYIEGIIEPEDVNKRILV